jgi:hypothetical protein
MRVAMAVLRAMDYHRAVTDPWWDHYRYNPVHYEYHVNRAWARLPKNNTRHHPCHRCKNMTGPLFFLVFCTGKKILALKIGPGKTVIEILAGTQPAGIH